MAKALLTIALRRGVSSSLNSNYSGVSINLSDLIGDLDLPETTDELIVADVAIAINIVVPHESLELDLLGEDSAQVYVNVSKFKL